MDEIYERIKKAVEGLIYRSEYDYPIEPFYEVYSPTGNLDFLVKPYERYTINEFFSPLLKTYSWSSPEELENVSRIKVLRKVLLEGLRGIRVFEVGRITKDIYVVGRTPSGDYAGIKTKVVET